MNTFYFKLARNNHTYNLEFMGTKAMWEKSSIVCTQDEQFYEGDMVCVNKLIGELKSSSHSFCVNYGYAVDELAQKAKPALQVNIDDDDYAVEFRLTYC